MYVCISDSVSQHSTSLESPGLCSHFVPTALALAGCVAF